VAPQPQRESEDPRFQPVRPITTGWRVFIWTAGPLLWILGLAVVDWTIHDRDAIGVGLLVLAVSLVLSAFGLWLGHRRALRERKDGPPSD
jgi:hypothetical protein